MECLDNNLIVFRYNDCAWSIPITSINAQIAFIESIVHRTSLQACNQQDLHRKLLHIKDAIVYNATKNITHEDKEQKLDYLTRDDQEKQKRSFKNIVLFFQLIQEKLSKMAHTLLHLIKNPKVSEEKTPQSTFYRPLNGLQKIFLTEMEHPPLKVEFFFEFWIK